MRPISLIFASVCCVFSITTSTVFATVGCTITAPTASEKSANLFKEPDQNSELLLKIPLGDIVQYPDQELAPVENENWIWVRYDTTQKNIWNSGIYGWMRPENISDFCG